MCGLSTICGTDAEVQSVSDNNDNHQVAHSQSQSERTEHSVTLETFLMELSETVIVLLWSHFLLVAQVLLPTSYLYG